MEEAVSLSTLGRRLLLVVLGGIVAGHLVSLLTQSERWPFSHYPMFAGKPDPEWVKLFQLVGVTKEATAREFGLGTDWRYLQPLNERLLHEQLGRLSREPDARSLLQTAAADCLRRYEERRLAGRHAGPPLSAVRVYRNGWRLRPVLDRGPPEEAVLLAESRLAGDEQ